jgi:hypothetical protein
MINTRNHLQITNTIKNVIKENMQLGDESDTTGSMEISQLLRKHFEMMLKNPKYKERHDQMASMILGQGADQNMMGQQGQPQGQPPMGGGQGGMMGAMAAAMGGGQGGGMPPMPRMGGQGGGQGGMPPMPRMGGQGGPRGGGMPPMPRMGGQGGPMGGGMPPMGGQGGGQQQPNTQKRTMSDDPFVAQAFGGMGGGNQAQQMPPMDGGQGDGMPPMPPMGGQGGGQRGMPPMGGFRRRQPPMF